VLAPTESGNPQDDSRGFRRALGQFATGVTIISAAVDGQLVGVTANSFSSVSLDPPLVLWSIAKTSQSLALFRKATHFAVNVLASDQLELASRFARSGADKFSGVDWQAGIGGAPLFPGTAASFECVQHALIEAGDHYIMQGRVERYTRNERDLLLFSQGRFGLAVDYPATATETAAQAGVGNVQTTMLGILWDAFSGLSHGFQAERDALGLSITQGRVMSLVERNPDATVELLARKAFISPQAVDDALQGLAEAGFITRSGAGAQVTPTGREYVATLRRRANAFEASQLKDISAEELETTRKVLRALGVPRG